MIADAFDRGNAKANEVILIDEADSCIIDQDMKLPTIGTGMVIWLTATAFKTVNGIEEAYLQSKKFKICDSLMKKPMMIAPRETTLKAFLELCEGFTRPFTKLVYCEEDKVETIRDITGQSKIYVNESDSEIIEHLDTTPPGTVLVVTDPDLMRGFDYRAAHGIAFLMPDHLSMQDLTSKASEKLGETATHTQ